MQDNYDCPTDHTYIEFPIFEDSGLEMALTDSTIDLNGPWDPISDFLSDSAASFVQDLDEILPGNSSLGSCNLINLYQPKDGGILDYNIGDPRLYF